VIAPAAAPPPSPRPVRAAGGVVWRRRDGAVQVVLVHRPRYDDWSLPKGKLDAGESHRRAAIREVAEETGIDCEPGASLGAVTYDTTDGPKRVKWWAMAPVDGVGDGTGAEDPSEVDEVAWVDLAGAAELLTHDSDREVLSRFATRVAGVTDPPRT